jgi:hypothetical protein
MSEASVFSDMNVKDGSTILKMKCAIEEKDNNGSFSLPLLM